jgi:hypothetical protein
MPLTHLYSGKSGSTPIRPEVNLASPEKLGNLFFRHDKFGKTTNFHKFNQLSKAQGELKIIDTLLSTDDYRFDKNKREALLAKLQPLREAVSNDKAAKVLTEEEDFSKWLIGRGKEEDHMKTPWYRCPLTHLPSVREYIKTKLEMRKEFMKQIQELEIKQPDNIMDAWNYYKFIVNGDKDNLLGYLEDWSVSVLDKERMEANLGEELMKRIMEQPDKTLCMPDENLELLASDFRSYMELHMELNTKEKYKKTKVMEMRKKMLEKVAQYRHHDDIKRIWMQYIDQQTDYTEAIIFDINAMEELDKKRRRVEENWQFIVETRADLAIQPEVKNLFKKVLEDIRDRKKASYESLHKEVADMLMNPHKLPKIVKKMQQKKLRRNIPDELVAFAYGYEVDKDQIKKLLNGDFTSKWIEIMNECDELIMDLNDPSLVATLVQSVEISYRGLFGFYMPTDYKNFVEEAEPIVDRMVAALRDFEIQSIDPNPVEQPPQPRSPSYAPAVDPNRNEPSQFLQQQQQLEQSLQPEAPSPILPPDEEEEEEEEDAPDLRRSSRVRKPPERFS